MPRMRCSCEREVRGTVCGGHVLLLEKRRCRGVGEAGD
jgi:hypothetical protein